ELGVHLRADLAQAGVDILADGGVGHRAVDGQGAHAVDRRAVADGRRGRGGRRGGSLSEGGGAIGHSGGSGAGGERQGVGFHELRTWSLWRSGKVPSCRSWFWPKLG